jgi:hypothetical protein
VLLKVLLKIKRQTVSVIGNLIPRESIKMEKRVTKRRMRLLRTTGDWKLQRLVFVQMK